MANHSLTSRTGAVAGSAGANGTGIFTITYGAVKQNIFGGVIMYVKQASTSGLTLTPSVENSLLGTDQYGLQGTSGQIGISGTAANCSIVIPAGTANYKIPLPVTPLETTVVVSAAFSGGTNGTAVIDFTDEGDSKIFS